MKSRSAYILILLLMVLSFLGAYQSESKNTAATLSPVEVVVKHYVAKKTDVAGYRIIRTPIPKVTLKDTGTKTDPNGISYTELGYKKSDLPYDIVRNFYSDVNIVRSGKKYGLINSNLERVIPLEYDKIIRASYIDSKGGFGNVDKIFYAQKGNKWMTIESNIWEMWEFVAFGKSYNTSTDMFLLENCSAVVVDRDLLSFEYDGRELLLDTKEGFSLLPMLNGAKFDLYNTEGHLSGTVNAKLSYGHIDDGHVLVDEAEKISNE